MVDNDNADVKSAVASLKRAFLKHFDIKLHSKTDPDDPLVVHFSDEGSGTSVQYVGSNRGRWLKRTAPKHGFEYSGKQGRTLYVGNDDHKGPGEVVDVSEKAKPAPEKEAEEVVPDKVEVEEWNANNEQG
jgi:hypothetical protein